MIDFNLQLLLFDAGLSLLFGVDFIAGVVLSGLVGVLAGRVRSICRIEHFEFFQPLLGLLVTGSFGLLSLEHDDLGATLLVYHSTHDLSSRAR